MAQLIEKNTVTRLLAKWIIEAELSSDTSSTLAAILKQVEDISPVEDFTEFLTCTRCIHRKTRTCHDCARLYNDMYEEGPQEVSDD